MIFYVTFGQRWRREPHPYRGHPDGWTEVQAEDRATAIAKVNLRYKQHWSNIYESGEFTPEYYPKGMIERII